ncbi:MAG: 3-phosphoshikimate 1-carboxyvinyltransferase, partial [Elusimicrobia bacterium]|nr:3-phosphoshikimate 1-carboxyvinyltransferase [Elusimicrobiota bacterium]
MEWTIRPASKIQGKIEIPADKSITHRAIMFSSIAEGDSRIENYLPADDCMQTLKAFQNLGVKIEKDEETLLIHGVGLKGLKPFEGIIDAGNSGTTARLLTGILSGQDFISRISGDESLSRRPMKRIIEPLSMMGVKIKARENNFLPIEIEGSSKLRKIDYKSPTASAQVKSCIILAALQASGTSSIEEPSNSRNHTEIMLKARGVDIEIRGKKVSVKGPAKIKAMDMLVPSDISSAAFFMVAAAIMPGSSLEIPNVGVNPTRDGMLEVLKSMRASIEVRNQRKVSGEPVADI